MRIAQTAAAVLVAFLFVLSLTVGVFADKVDFEYKLTATDENGYEVTDLRSVPAGSTLTMEIEIKRGDVSDPSYVMYGLELRLRDLGLKYNKDGACFRAGTDVRELTYADGDSVGFAYYDMRRVGESINNPVLGARWTYTVEDPSAVNISVPVALMYVPELDEGQELIGNAYFRLVVENGEFVGDDISGEYPSGTVLTLPDARFGEAIFVGWTDGVNIYPAGYEFTVSGYTTLKAIFTDIVRDRQIIVNPNGGKIDGDDPSGLYADGEKLVLPGAVREGYNFLGWKAGDGFYAAGDEYTVDNSVVFMAQWESTETETVPGTETETGPVEPGEKPEPFNFWPIVIAAACLLLALGILWFIILWKRRWVLYSLKTGDIALSFKDNDHNVQVRVVLLDGDNNHVVLGTSGVVEKGKRLRFIKGTGEIADVEAGRYKGRLLVADGEYKDVVKCRIKVLDREIREREND